MNRMIDTVTFDTARVALKGASDLEDTSPGAGLRRGDRVRITVEGNVTERKEITRTNGLIEWVKVIEVDKSYDLVVLDRLTELPFEVTMTVEEAKALGLDSDGVPLTVDGETGEVTGGRNTAREPARG